MNDKPQLTPSQLQLLTDLIALEDKGLIHKGSTEYLRTGDYEGDGTVEVPPVVTLWGRIVINE